VYALLLALATSQPDTTALAPTPAEFQSALGLLADHLRDADAYREATARLHNAWAEATPRKPCSSAEDASLAARALAFGGAWRDAAQAARAQFDRVTPWATAPTLAPLLDPAEVERLAALHRRVDAHGREVIEASAWHARWIAPAVRTCPPPLASSRGLPRAERAAEGEHPVAVAIIGLGGGTLCPGAVPAHGQPVVMAEGRACLGDPRCTCVPRPVLPAEVLGSGF
jgi:hypothetical protein